MVIRKEGIYVQKKELNAFTFDATDCPDLFPPLASLAVCCVGKSVIKGISRLKHKESDRALTIKEELGKLGVQVDLRDDDMEITGTKIIGGSVSSRNDHRIAMAIAILGSVADEVIQIDQAQAVNKSYPGFYNDLNVIREQK